MLIHWRVATHDPWQPGLLAPRWSGRFNDGRVVKTVVLRGWPQVVLQDVTPLPIGSMYARYTSTMHPMA